MLFLHVLNLAVLEGPKETFDDLQVCAGLHQLTPYLTQLIAEEGRGSLKSLPTLHLLLQVSCDLHPKPFCVVVSCTCICLSLSHVIH